MALPDYKKLIDFYESRYNQGYMEDWPAETKKRIFQIIKELPLPAEGTALDFGCGNGVLTEVLRLALPSWKIYGTDISKTAIENAQKRFPHCKFISIDSEQENYSKFNFLFTHHVLEHVSDAAEVFSEAEKYLKPESSMLHILPCGNEGSYEHHICSLRKDGINYAVENRFFFEEEGHLRRLTSKQLNFLCESKNFKLQKEYYSNQYYGAIKWITEKSPKFILRFSDPGYAVSNEARKKLVKERFRLLAINLSRLPSV